MHFTTWKLLCKHFEQGQEKEFLLESYSTKPTATLTFQLPRYEANRRLVLLLHNLDTSMSEMISLPLPELPRPGNPTGIDACFPDYYIGMDFTSLPVDWSATIPLRVDLFALQAGRYELIKWAGGIAGSEQRLSLIVPDTND